MSTTSMGGTVACGHPVTAAAGIEILEDGGNAFDASVAALATAFVAEPVLASPGGGGFLLSSPAAGPELLYDFFCQTPAVLRNPATLDFYPISADFGTAEQEFHIGRGSVAVPGVVAGMFAINRDLGSLPMRRVLEPAIRHARDCLAVNAFQSRILHIVAPIFRATDSARRLFRPPCGSDRLPIEGELLGNAGLADTLQLLAEEGEAAFYEGSIADEIVDFCAAGGLLTGKDLSAYRVQRRPVLETSYRGVRVVSNPPPSSGGLLIAFALQLLERLGPPSSADEVGRLLRLAEVMAMTGRARLAAGLDSRDSEHAIGLLDPDLLERYAHELRHRPACTRGTTHISVVDSAGNEASLTISNGEGCGEMLGDTGIMLNNMLGEEDLHPDGFHNWTPGTRMTSMMAPTLLSFPCGRRVALGSGGSNRIRSAILQVILNLVDRELELEQAVAAPRIHLEQDLLSIEPGQDCAAIEALCATWPQHHLWEQSSLFFGGVHAVSKSADRIDGAGDPRRGGVSLTTTAN